MRRVRQPSGADRPAHQAAIDVPSDLGLYELARHCADIRYEDGGERQVGWYKVDVVGTEWQCRVSDPDSECSFVARGVTMLEALRLASALLGAENCPWAPDRFLKGRAAPKKKK